jgi:hypothetical protein
MERELNGLGNEGFDGLKITGNIHENKELLNA